MTYLIINSSRCIARTTLVIAPLLILPIYIQREHQHEQFSHNLASGQVYLNDSKTHARTSTGVQAFNQPFTFS